MASKKVKKQKASKKRFFGWKKDGKNYIYYFKDSVARQYGIQKIDFIGFPQPPVGLMLLKSGGGFNLRQSNKVGGAYFLYFLESKYKRPLKLSILNTGYGANSFKILKGSIAIKIQFSDFFEIIKGLGDEIKIKRDEIVEKRLADYFPDKFSTSAEEDAYKLLSDINLNKVSEDEHKILGDFIKRYISLNSNNEYLSELQHDLAIQGRKQTLNQVIKKFEAHLKDKSFDEKKWQKFLHEDIFFFISNYIESVREANVNFGKTEDGEKKPDFVWIDIYGFLDVFEIKTPYTDILARRIDSSHKNYYFSSEAAKAISQIEKYILFLERNVEGFEKYLSKQTKIPFSVLKPKAFLIIGSSGEFENSPDKKKDFRLLRRLFKNIEFITFDELLDNLKNLASKFEKA